MLLTPKVDSKLTTAAEVDSLISAELPDEIREPVLYRIVVLTMVHRPHRDRNRNPPYRQNDQCSLFHDDSVDGQTQDFVAIATVGFLHDPSLICFSTSGSKTSELNPTRC